MTPRSVAELVRAARKNRSQKEFASWLGVKQSSVSRYESGRSSPSTEVINRCMHLVNADSVPDIPSAEELARRLRVELDQPGMAGVRVALSSLLDAVRQMSPGDQTDRQMH